MDINEYNKYKNDKVKFASKFFHAVDLKRGKHVKKPLYDHQKVILNADDHLLIKKARYTGISEAIAFEIAYHLNYSKDYNMLVICPTMVMAHNIRDKVIRHFSFIPDNIRVGTTATMKNSYATEINACVEFRNGDVNGLGHASVSDAIYIEEADSIVDFDQVYAVLSPTLSRKGKMVITSTPGTTKAFQRLWTQKNKFNKLVVTTNSHTYNAVDEKTLNALSKAQYDKIIRECVIL